MVASAVAVTHTVVVPPDEVAVTGRVIGAAHQLVTATSRRLLTGRGMQDPARRDQELLDAAAPMAINRPQLRIIERHRLSVRRAVPRRTIMLPGSEAVRHVGGREPVSRLDHTAALAEERVQAEPRKLGEALAGRGVEAFEAATR